MCHTTQQQQQQNFLYSHGNNFPAAKRQKLSQLRSPRTHNKNNNPVPQGRNVWH